MAGGDGPTDGDGSWEAMACGQTGAGLVASMGQEVQADSRPSAGRQKAAARFPGRHSCIVTSLQKIWGTQAQPWWAGGAGTSFPLT